jgi:hypothetical protein
MILLALLCTWWCRKELKHLFLKLWKMLRSGEWVFYLLVAIAIAFYTSRGTFHTDTNIYHAQAIRITEEYGLIKGMANLQLHFGYNSAYLVFCALFTFSWILPTALHTTTGFLELVVCTYAFRQIRVWSGLSGRNGERHQRSWMVIGASAAVLFYLLINITGSMSPATDYAAMFLILYVIEAWVSEAASSHLVQAENMKKNSFISEISDQSLCRYGLLSVMALFMGSMKLSVACFFIVALYPICMFLKRKKYGMIGICFALCVLVFLPFLIRNVLISGWLFYPFEAIDLFDVPWKVPAAYSLVDSAQIKVYGRCLYDISLVDEPMSRWLPVWWNCIQHYEQTMIYAVILSIPLLLMTWYMRFLKNRKTGVREMLPEIWALYLGLWVSFLIWFMVSPFIRYGLAFILAIPMIAIGYFIDTFCITYAKSMLGWYAGGMLVILMLICYGASADNYAMDDLVFIKHNLTQNYYIWQKPFDEKEMSEENLNGNVIYYDSDGILNSYDVCPSTCYQFMLNRTELMGDTIQDGFKAKDVN